jgi:type I restriction enzyme S subunit
VSNNLARQWTTFRLGNVCTKIGSGATPRGGSGVYLERGEVALIRSQNVYNDGFHPDGLVYLTEKHADELANVEVSKGDILLNITGDSVARACQVDPEVLPARVNQHVAIIRPDPDQLCPLFLRYFLVSPSMQSHMLSLAGAGATRNALTKGMIESFEVPAPECVIEQQAIACVLGTLDDKIELNRRRNRTLEAMARAIFQSWFVDFDPVRAKAAGKKPPGLKPELAALFPDRFEDSPLGPIPKGWRVGTVGDVAELNGWTLGKRDGLEEIDYIEISEVMRGEIAKITRYVRGEEPGRARRRLRHGDTAISTVRPDRGSYFLCLDPSPTLIASTGFAVLTAKNGHWAFVHVLTTRKEFGEELGRLADGGAYPAVRPEVIAAQQVILPNTDKLLNSFEKIAQPLFFHAQATRNESRTLAALRDALLPKLISGELRIADADRIVGRAV